MFNLQGIRRPRLCLCFGPFVTSRSSPALPSVLSPSNKLVKDLAVPFSPVFLPTLNKTLNNAGISLHDFVFEAPKFVYVEHPLILDPFDFSDLDMENNRSPLINNPQGAGNIIIIEVIKSLSLNVATKLQRPLGLGERVDELDGVLTSIIFRMAIDLALVALFGSSARRISMEEFAVQLAVYYTAVIPFRLLLDIIHKHLFLFDTLDALLGAYLPNSMHTYLTRRTPPPPPPPPPPGRKKQEVASPPIVPPPASPN
ncbi:hypothetical protein C8R46DRAFT_1043175 [Mycena filopes]|nr:hypothetical protein C8R46DRAFT_1043175 [Mycena filopes]